jgi:hypothetical protein
MYAKMAQRQARPGTSLGRAWDGRLSQLWEVVHRHGNAMDGGW